VIIGPAAFAYQYCELSSIGWLGELGVGPRIPSGAPATAHSPDEGFRFHASGDCAAVKTVVAGLREICGNQLCCVVLNGSC